MLMFDHLCNSGHWLQKFLRTRRRLLAWLSLPCVALAISLVVHSQTAPPAIPPVALADDPLYATGTREKPTMALALSVEWPTAGAQYLGAPNSTLDTTYTPSTEYIGYYDTESCYAYNDSPTETPLASQSKADYKRFDRIGPATGRTCADAFSGNFLNWSSSSAIDMLRLALSGGDRYIDREDLTILQRAVLPDGDPQCLWNSVTFPSKIVLRNGGGTGNYWGAVPIAMRAAAGAYNIYVLNTLNKIYFGLSASGGCGGKNGAQRLAAEVPNRVAPAVNVAQALPADASPACATEDVTCTFSGIKEVWYGTGTQWAVAPASDSVLCSAPCLATLLLESPKHATRAITPDHGRHRPPQLVLAPYTRPSHYLRMRWNVRPKAAPAHLPGSRKSGTVQAPYGFSCRLRAQSHATASRYLATLPSMLPRSATYAPTRLLEAQASQQRRLFLRTRQGLRSGRVRQSAGCSRIRIRAQLLHPLPQQSVQAHRHHTKIQQLVPASCVRIRIGPRLRRYR